MRLYPTVLAVSLAGLWTVVLSGGPRARADEARLASPPGMTAADELAALDDPLALEQEADEPTPDAAEVPDAAASQYLESTTTGLSADSPATTVSATPASAVDVALAAISALASPHTERVTIHLPATSTLATAHPSAAAAAASRPLPAAAGAATPAAAKDAGSAGEKTGRHGATALPSALMPAPALALHWRAPTPGVPADPATSGSSPQHTALNAAEASGRGTRLATYPRPRQTGEAQAETVDRLGLGLGER